MYAVVFSASTRPLKDPCKEKKKSSLHRRAVDGSRGKRVEAQVLQVGPRAPVAPIAAAAPSVSSPSGSAYEEPTASVHLSP